MKHIFKSIATVSALLFLMSGCGLFGNRDPGHEVVFFRDVDVDLASTTRFNAKAFSGFWNIRSEFARAGDLRSRAGVDFQIGPNGEIVQIALHGPKRRGRFGAIAHYEVEQSAPGRFVFGAPPYTTEYWILWVDANYRTAVIGTPSGTFGWIIDRNRTDGEDRIAAGKEILEWMGYDMNYLVDLP